MNQHRHRSQLVAEMARRFIRAVARNRYTTIIAVLLALVTGMAAIVPPALSDAATTQVTPNTGGIGWVPIAVSQNNKNGNCWVEADGDAEGNDSTSTAEMQQVNAGLAALGPVNVNAGGITTITANELAPTDSIDTPFTVQANVDCSVITQTDAYVKKLGYGSTVGFTQMVLDACQHPAPAGSRLHAEQHAVLLAYDAAPAWVTSAIAAIASAAVFFAVAALVAGAAAALGTATGPGAVLTTAALGALSGCVGGLASEYVDAAITGSASSPETAGSAVGYCLGYGAVGAVSAPVLGAWLGNSLRSALGLPAAGATATAAQAADVELSVLGSQGVSAVASSSSAASDADRMAQVLVWLESGLMSPVTPLHPGSRLKGRRAGPRIGSRRYATLLDHWRRRTLAAPATPDDGPVQARSGLVSSSRSTDYLVLHVRVARSGRISRPAQARCASGGVWTRSLPARRPGRSP